MTKAIFEHDGDTGRLCVITHFKEKIEIPCKKNTGELFRLGGTAVNQIQVYEGLVLNLETGLFRGFYNSEEYFEGTGLLSSEQWDNADTHCFITEFYDLNVEGKKPGWFISKNPIKEPNRVFINLDVLDGGGNPVKRYRVSPFTGKYRIMEMGDV